MGSNSTKCRAA